MQKLTQEKVLEQFKEKHGDYYDYSKVVYKNNRTKVIIECPKHGDFLQLPKNHKKGEGCPICCRARMTGRPKGTILGKKDFVEKAKLVHSGKYCYADLVFTTLKTPTNFICPIHGVFTQLPKSHVAGRGCRKCGTEKAANSRRGIISRTTEEFLAICIPKQKREYDYSDAVYRGINKKISIICPIHGVFHQNAGDHAQGKGCKKCGYSTSVSKREQELADFIESLGFDIKTNDRELLEGNELDVLIPSKNLAIEYNGLYWHSEQHKDKQYHFDKSKNCTEKRYQLIHIWADTWKTKKPLVKSFIKSKLGIFDKKIHGRKCTVKKVSHKVSSEFYDKNHLQGRVSATSHLGLYLDKELVSVMSFKKKEDETYDLNRFCSKKGYLVRGGFSKLLKHFIKNNSVSKIISFSDNTYSDGGVYINNGFKKVKDLPVDYKYIWEGELKHKFGFRKARLAKMFDNTDGKTEHEICLENNVFRVYDAGKQKFELNIQ